MSIYFYNLSLPYFFFHLLGRKQIQKNCLFIQTIISSFSNVLIQFYLPQASGKWASAKTVNYPIKYHSHVKVNTHTHNHVLQPHDIIIITKVNGLLVCNSNKHVTYCQNNSILINFKEYGHCTYTCMTFICSFWGLKIHFYLCFQ